LSTGNLKKRFLDDLDQPVEILRGVGLKNSTFLGKLNIITLKDLICHFPRNYLDRTRIDPLSETLKKERSNCLVLVTAHHYIGRGYRKILKVTIQDRSGKAFLICFGRKFLSSVLVPGRKFIISGTFRYQYGELQCSNFEYEAADVLDREIDRILPVYPLTNGLNQSSMRRWARQALTFCRNIEDVLPRYLQVKHSFPGYAEALRRLHFPGSEPELTHARRCFIYYELFYLQLIMKRRGLKLRAMREKRRPISFKLRDTLIARLPFRLTDHQKSALSDIENDLFSDRLMSRLLQGDVGCGKTLVALLAALSVVEAGEQAAIMAPTELLARQHGETAAGFLEPLGVRVALLTGTLGKTGRSLLLQSLREGDIQILIGTHALFSEDVSYRSLGLVVVDEQQRFGVKQRMALMAKGSTPDLLLMTATPIPRSLALTVFGDLDVSTIRTMPPDRKAVITHLTRGGNEHRVYQRVREEIQLGRQAYFVYPMIEPSDKIALKAAEDMYETLKTHVFSDLRIALIHSKVDEEEKHRRMQAFITGRIDILVATSVVEVGVDVPNAACMVVEHAERFGLSALHQLRGRVGRGECQSYAFLIYSRKLTEDGVKRLKTMMETSDGFRIAQVDLSIRGPGELLGVRQAGFMKFSMADLSRDTEILIEAREDVLSLLSGDPGLLKPEHEIIRNVLAEHPPFDETHLNGG
jgi:ATP-dependent DNA helicase RecG